ncbi:fimbrial biogenesis outer membrane usher protein, partial [Escherichia coli]|nr:fimbrial biogenesis outer membrane usher protein [Escherichia coli]
MKTKISPIAYMLIMAGFSYNNDLLAKKSDYIFDSAYVNGSDVTRFNDGQQLPGKYLVTVSVNEQRKKVGSYKVNFEYRGETLTPV